jgi:2'-5' RNA ligase
VARALRHSRPPLPRFAVAWFPAFEGIERIEAFRRKHDPVAQLIPAHLSLVFPFPTAHTRLQVQTHVQRVVSRWPPLAVTLRRVRLHANECLFLMASRGAAAVTALHDKLSTRSLQPHLRRDLPYEPHITLARLKRGSGHVGNLLEQSGGLSSPPFEVADFALFESTLTPEGAVYSIVERYPLG